MAASGMAFTLNKTNCMLGPHPKLIVFGLEPKSISHATRHITSATGIIIFERDGSRSFMSDERIK